MEEIWKDIEGYEGLYQVSNFGRVKSLERFQNNHLSLQYKPEKIKTPQITGMVTYGYLYIRIIKLNRSIYIDL